MEKQEEYKTHKPENNPYVFCVTNTSGDKIDRFSLLENNDKRILITSGYPGISLEKTLWVIRAINQNEANEKITQVDLSHEKSIKERDVTLRNKDIRGCSSWFYSPYMMSCMNDETKRVDTHKTNVSNIKLSNLLEIEIEYLLPFEQLIVKIYTEKPK